MDGRVVGAIAAFMLVPLFAAPLAGSAEAEGTEAKEAAKQPRKKAKKPKLSPEAAEKRYQSARELEKKGDEKGALAAYLQAGNSGHGLAQKRLGEIYERGNSATKRDYDTALRWYEKARAQGIEIPKPMVYQKSTR